MWVSAGICAHTGRAVQSDKLTTAADGDYTTATVWTMCGTWSKIQSSWCCDPMSSCYCQLCYWSVQKTFWQAISLHYHGKFKSFFVPLNFFFRSVYRWSGVMAPYVMCTEHMEIFSVSRTRWTSSSFLLCPEGTAPIAFLAKLAHTCLLSLPPPPPLLLDSYWTCSQRSQVRDTRSIEWFHSFLVSCYSGCAKWTDLSLSI